MQQDRHDIHACTDGVFNSRAGLLIDLYNPDPATIHIEDIAGALSKICRFGGQCDQFYSVAQHSVLVCAMAPEDSKLEALLHDATEAYLGDVIKPLKVILGQSYKEVEDRFENVIINRFELDRSKLKSIKHCDAAALEIEHNRLQLGDINYWYQHVQPLGFAGDIWEPQYAEHVFMAYFKAYKNEYTWHLPNFRG